MANNKKSVLLYCDIIHTVEQLDDVDAGMLFKHYLRYINDQNPEPPSKLIQIVFEPIKQNLKRDLKKWEEKSNKRSSAGSIGAESKWGKSENNLLRSERLAIARTKGTHNKKQWEELLEICDFTCVKCGSSNDIVKDHIIPIYQGGSDGIDNLQPLCRTCNSSKGADKTNHILIYINKMPDKFKNAYECLTKIADKVTVTVKDNVIVKDKVINKYNAKAFLCSLGFDEKLIDEWFVIRKSKKLTNTETAMQGFLKEVEKTGCEKNEILRRCVENSWGGFKASWTSQNQKSESNKPILNLINSIYGNNGNQ